MTITQPVLDLLKAYVAQKGKIFRVIDKDGNYLKFNGKTSWLSKSAALGSMYSPYNLILFGAAVGARIGMRNRGKEVLKELITTGHIRIVEVQEIS